MAQIILEPSVAHLASVTWKPEYPIPPALRQWGYCPNIEDWLPGDLILVSHTDPGLIARSIRKVQEKGGYAQEDACWEHAAVYIGYGALCEADRKGVRLGDIFYYARQYRIRVRRNNGLDEAHRWKLVANALRQKGDSYNYASIVGILWKAHNGFWQNHGGLARFPEGAAICSELYADAHYEACQVVIGNLRAGAVTPASLSLDTTLVDVPTHWLKIT